MKTNEKLETINKIMTSNNKNDIVDSLLAVYVAESDDNLLHLLMILPGLYKLRDEVNQPSIHS